MSMTRPLLRLLACALLLTLRVSIARADDKAQTEETWDAVFMGKDKIGHEHTVVRHFEKDGQKLLEVRLESVAALKRGGQTMEMTMELTSVETLEGKLLRLDNRSRESKDETRTVGEVTGKTMKLTLTTRGKQSTFNIPWSDDVLGPNAEDQIIKKEGLKPGQKRTFRQFMPQLNQIITVGLYGEESEEVELLGGTKQKLQRVRSQIENIPALKNLKTLTWIDESGESLKSYTDMPGGGMTTYRCTKEVALAKPTAVSVDLLTSTLVKTDKQIPRPYEASEVVYRIAVKEDDPLEAIPQDGRQKLSKGDNGDVLLTIRSVDPTQEPADAAKPPGPEFLRANNYLQTDNDKVVQAAKQAVGDATDAWDKAKRIEKWVFQHVAEKNFNIGFASAAEVAENLEGDCTEHGVLLAAMARAVGIPARVATGLVYVDRLKVEGQHVFGYHMWAEVFINGQWVPLDGTLGMGHASPVHIKVADSSLEGVDYLATLLPVFRVMERLKIEVVSWKHPEAN